MARNVWHKRYQGDALNGYMGLTLEQRGAYTTLLDLMYDTDWELGIRDHDRWIAGHLNVSVRRWNSLRAELIEAEKIDVVDGFISNFRYRKEREKALETSRKRAESGASGGVKSGEARRKPAENSQSDEASASVLPLYACATDTDTEADKNKNISETYVSSPDAVRPDEVVEAWNEMAKRRGLPTIRGLTPKRKIALKSRIRDHPLQEWQDALNAIERSPFLLGENNSGWRASFDFLLQPSSFQKLIEGSYDRK